MKTVIEYKNDNKNRTWHKSHHFKLLFFLTQKFYLLDLPYFYLTFLSWYFTQLLRVRFIQFASEKVWKKSQ